MMHLVGTHYSYARRRQEIAIAEADYGKTHAFVIVIAKGPVNFKLGSTAGAQDVLADRILGTGQHIISFEPTANVHIELAHVGYGSALVESVSVHPAGDLVLTNGYEEDELDLLRVEQSGDVIFIACDGRRQRKLLRRATHSWSLEDYAPNDGPFLVPNQTSITLTPSATHGDIGLDASQPLFVPGQEGALFRIESRSQQVVDSLSGNDQYSGTIRVTGTGANREFSLKISGVWADTLTLQEAFGEDLIWQDVSSYSANTDTTINDGLDNQIVFYRIGFKSGDYASGTADVELAFAAGSKAGVVRIDHIASSTEAEATVLSDLGDASPSEIWAEGAWSDKRGFPTAVALYEGRLWWVGRNKYWGSISDGYEEFDDLLEGDAGPVSRSIGRGPVDRINWIAPMTRLTVGAEGSEFTIRASSIDEVLTPTNNSIKAASTQGSAGVAAVVVDSEALFVHRSGSRVYAFGPASDGISDYGSVEMTLLAPEIGEPSIIRMAVQRQPDTRVHCVRSDGKVAVFIYSKLENVRCWVLVDCAEGYDVVDVVVLPGDIEDQVYYLIKTPEDTYYLAKWALESEAIGGTLNKQADLFVEYTGGAVTSLNGLDHFPDGTVLVGWAGGKEITAELVVDSGAVELGAAYTHVVVGLGYDALFKSTKLSRTMPDLFQRKKVNSIGLALLNTHKNGITYGPDEDHLDSLPLVEDEKEIAANKIWDTYEKDVLDFDGNWEVDARVVLKAQAPRPCTVQAMVLQVETNPR